MRRINFLKVLICTVFVLVAIVILRAQIIGGSQLYINYTLSSSDTTLSPTGIVSSYVASWSHTNDNTNWTEFSYGIAGQSNIPINPSLVPCPSDIKIQAVTTNGIRSANTNYTRYDTNIPATWVQISNLYVSPPAPAGGAITN